MTKSPSREPQPSFPQEVIFVHAAAYQTMYAASALLIVLLPWLVGSIPFAVAIWLFAARPFAMLVFEGVCRYWRPASAVYAAVTVEAFVADWRYGAMAVGLMAALLLLAASTADKWRKALASPV